MTDLPKDAPADFMSAIAWINGKKRLELEDLKVMILIECAGEPLYYGMADAVGNEEAAELLRKNGREETAHAHRLKQAIEILTGVPHEIPSLADNPYANLPSLGPISGDVLAGVVAAEKSGDVSYHRFAHNEPNEEVAALLRQNGREETGHAKRVTQVMRLLSAS